MAMRALRAMLGPGAGFALCVAGCAAPVEPVPPGPSTVLLAQPVLRSAERVEITPGMVLVLPLDQPPDQSQPLTVALADGRALEAHAASITVRFELSAAGAPIDPWVGSPGEWVMSASTAPPSGAASALALVPVPVDAQGGDLIVNGAPRSVEWLPTADALPRAEDGSPADPWRPGRPDRMPAGVELSPRFIAETQSPLTRWRWRLLYDGLHPDAPGPGPFADEGVEHLAAQLEHRWRVALARLWGGDSDLAMRLKRRLCAGVDFGDGLWAPAWPTDRAALDELLSTLLDSRLPPQRRAAFVERWLAEQPAGVAWVTDDGGTLDADRAHVLVTLSAASLLDRATLSWVQPEGVQTSPELRPITPMSVRTFVTPPGTASSLGDGAVSVHIGEWSQRFSVHTGPIPISPPGVMISPFFADTSMTEWLSGRASPGAWACAARLHRPPADPGALGESVRSKRWELYVECETVEGAGDPGAESVMIFAGPLGLPSAAIRVAIDGEVTRLTLPGAHPNDAELPPERTKVPVIRSPGRWAFRIPLPPGSVEKDGLLRLGLFRTDALGRRSAWPRPVLPWRAEPSRLAIDTRTWSALGDEVDPEEGPLADE